VVAASEIVHGLAGLGVTFTLAADARTVLVDSPRVTLSLAVKLVLEGLCIEDDLRECLLAETDLGVMLRLSTRGARIGEEGRWPN
jgi:hypothetical protein